MSFDSRLAEAGPVDRAGTLALARGAGRLLVKAGAETVRVDAGAGPLAEADAVRYLLHEDGFLRVPVLVVGDLLVRGFTDDLYREALGVGGGG
ncbi:MAG: hypothetical protein ACREM3_15520 [Candidatus Rokuibacteriota bacterium]